MEIPEFVYHRPATLAEACELGRTYGDEARFLAGGTELLVDLKQKRHSAGHMISLRDIPDLGLISLEGESLRIGAMATLEEVAASDVVQRIFPTLCEAVLTIGSVQIRNQATIGGNFCGAVPCADAPPICIAGEAQLRITGVDGERILPAEEFFIAPRASALQPGELLVEILIPFQPQNSGASYQRFSLRHGSSLAVASVAARIILEKEEEKKNRKDKRIADARVVLGAVAPTPLPTLDCMDLLAGQQPSEELYRRASKVAAEEAKPITDIRGSEDFRRSLVEVLTFRALREAAARAEGAERAGGAPV